MCVDVVLVVYHVVLIVVIVVTCCCCVHACNGDNLVCRKVMVMCYGGWPNGDGVYNVVSCVDFVGIDVVIVVIYVVVMLVLMVSL